MIVKRYSSACAFIAKNNPTLLMKARSIMFTNVNEEILHDLEVSENDTDSGWYFLIIAITNFTIAFHY